MSRKTFALAAAVAAAILSGPAQAQEYPDRAVKVIVPFAAGGSTDVVARVVADGLSHELKQPFVVENRPGAGGALGTDLVAKAKPDGYTIGMVGTGSITIIPYMDPKLSYSPSRDLAVVAILSTVDLLVVARADSPHKTMKDLVAFARGKPGELTYSTAGIGTPTHLDMENFWKLSDAKALHVPYSGDAPALNAVLAGDVAIGLVSASAASPLIQAGKLKAIAFGGPNRSAAFPDIPSMAEQSEMKDYTASTWNAVMAPAETPRPIIEKINAAVNKIFGNPEVKQKFANLGLTVFVGDTRAATDFVNRDAATRKRVIELVGLKRE